MCSVLHIGSRMIALSSFVSVLVQVLRPLLYQLDMGLLERLVDKLRVQPPDEVIEDTVTFIKDIAEATQQARPQQLERTDCGQNRLRQLLRGFISAGLSSRTSGVDDDDIIDVSAVTLGPVPSFPYLVFF